MTSLFSPFDYFFFSKSIYVMGSIFVVFSFFTSLLSLTKISSSISTSFLSVFFCSLKSKNMNKFSSLLFIASFMMLFLFNFYSVFSFNFPFTSQTSLVFSLSLGVWLSFISFSVFWSFKKFFFHLVPEGAPLVLVPLLFLIELVSSAIRPLTLMIRLVANILAGHLLMILLSSLVFYFSYSYPFYIVLNMVEMFVAIIQAYIFSTMMVLYFSEV